jgi:Uma2 family endonuclease
MSTTLVPLSEYLHEVYRPDCEYVDGAVLERNVGEKEHAAWQLALGRLLSRFRTSAQVRVFPELRLQVAPARFRVPDMMLVSRAAPDEQIITHPPLLCVEILSPEDRFGRVNERLADYARMGVHAVWVIDPTKQIGYQCSGDTFQHWTQASPLTVPGTPISLTIEEIVADLD